MKKHIMALIMASIMITISNAAPEAQKPQGASITAMEGDSVAEYLVLESVARKALTAALQKGDQKMIDSSMKALDTITRARFLSAAAEVNETFSDSLGELIEQFKPQIKALPTMIRGAGSMGLFSNKDLYPPLASALANWLNASNESAAKLALEDFSGLMKAQETYHETYSKIRYSSSPNQNESFQEKEERAVKAGRLEADRLVASGK